jgi:Bax protein
LERTLSKYLNPKNILLAFISITLVVSAYFFFIDSKTKPLPKMTVQEKKARFKSIVLPVAQEVYSELTERYNDVAAEIKNGNSAQFADLKEEYKASSDKELLMALKPHPISITLAQAAMESAWATSRFFREANNIFGVWSFDEDEPRIAAGEKRGSKTIWVKKYSSEKAAIKDYYRTLARGSAFDEFRAIKMSTSDPHKIVKKLNRYSEKGAEYGKELSAIINFNKFQQYDK